MNGKINKAEHITTSYRCFETFNEVSFLSDLATESESFYLSNSSVDEDFTLWYSIVQGNLDKHALVKTRRVKSKRLPEWFTSDILNARRTRDYYKRAKNWSQYKLYRNKTRDLIRKAKRRHFSESIESNKDPGTLWKHFRSVTNKSNAPLSSLPHELTINNVLYTDSELPSSLMNFLPPSVNN